MNDEIRYKALVKHIEEWESLAFDLYSSKRDKYGECDQEVAILKGGMESLEYAIGTCERRSQNGTVSPAIFRKELN